jgi:hypothetical protein
MSENEFFVAIQGVMTQAFEAGLTIPTIFQQTLDAAEEWLEEMGDEFDEEEDE